MHNNLYKTAEGKEEKQKKNKQKKISFNVQREFSVNWTCCSADAFTENPTATNEEFWPHFKFDFKFATSCVGTSDTNLSWTNMLNRITFGCTPLSLWYTASEVYLRTYSLAKCSFHTM